MKPIIWNSCYDKSLKGFITDQSFGHPAKYSLGLIERIFDHCLEKGYLKPGDVVGDCFGGVAIGGIVAAYRRLHWVGQELEPRFVGWARANIALHKSKLAHLGFPIPYIFQGDSRKFRERVQAVVSSPPYANTTEGNKTCGVDWEKAKRQTGGGGEHQTPGASVSGEYGQSEGQIARLRPGTVEAVVSSPPYAPDVVHGRPSKMTEGIFDGRTAKTGLGDYGKTEGQIGGLKAGTVDACISSPPYATIAAGAGGLNTKPAKHAGQQSGRSGSAASQDTDQKYGQTPGQIAQLKPGTVDACVSSPPYAESIHAAGNKDWKETPSETQSKHGNKGYCGQIQNAGAGYGKTEGQIGALKPGTVDACVSSPPYAETLSHGGGPDTKQDLLQGGKSLQAIKAGYGETEGNIGELKAGNVDAVVTSPPFRDARSDTTKSSPVKSSEPSEGRPSRPNGPVVDRFHTTQAGAGYGSTEGQIDNLPTGDVHGVVTSPPWEANSEGGRRKKKFKDAVALLKNSRGNGASDAAVLAQAARDEQKTYGDSEGQIGKEKGETYWQAMAQVYASCFQAIKSGGVIVLVVKDYCKDGKRVRLCDDTMRLLEHVGFKPLERIHAMLVSETTESDLFEGDVTTKRQRKSFFRRLYEANIPEGDERRIDHEEVLIAVKPWP